MIQKSDVSAGRFYSFFKKGASNPVERFHGIKPPNGLDEIILEFGNIYNHIRNDGTLDGSWEFDQMASAPLPFAIPLACDRSKAVTRILCHKKLVKLLTGAFEEISQQRQERYVTSYGCCFNFRSKQSSHQLSAHCWGIAIDLNTELDYRGRGNAIHESIVRIFKTHGFEWGGDWSGKRRNPMHFQFCRGY
jgi:hypothetical protein